MKVLLSLQRKLNLRTGSVNLGVKASLVVDPSTIAFPVWLSFTLGEVCCFFFLRNSATLIDVIFYFIASIPITTLKCTKLVKNRLACTLRANLYTKTRMESTKKYIKDSLNNSVLCVTREKMTTVFCCL